RTPSCVPAPTSGARLVRRELPSAAKYGERLGWIESSHGPVLSGRWLSGRKHPPAKRVGGVKLPRGFESLPSRSQRLRLRRGRPTTAQPCDSPCPHQSTDRRFDSSHRNYDLPSPQISHPSAKAVLRELLSPGLV